MKPARPLLLLLATMPSPTWAEPPKAVGQYGRWAAFRTADAQGCYAIAQPSERRDERAFATIAVWPRRGIGRQVHVRLRRPMAEATLMLGSARFPLVMAGADGWARAADGPRIAARIRAADTLRIEARDHGRYFTDSYDLTGAASAIDAAAIACLKER